MTPLAAIRVATIVAAELMGWSDRVGTLSPVDRADLVAVADDPLADISALERPAVVVQGGRLIQDPKGLVLRQLQVVEQGGDLARVRRAVVAEAVVHEHERLARLGRRLAHTRDPAPQLVAIVEVAETLGWADAPGFPRVGIATVEAHDGQVG